MLDVMKELHILRLVDIRGNADEGLLGVLENGEHYTTFSTYQVAISTHSTAASCLSFGISTMKSY